MALKVNKVYCTTAHLVNTNNLQDIFDKGMLALEEYEKRNPMSEKYTGFKPGTDQNDYQDAYEDALNDWFDEWNSGVLPPGSYTIDDTYGPRTPQFENASPNHQGVDLGAPYGTPIFAVTDGYASVHWDTKGSNTGYGHYLTISSKYEGDNRVDFYGHMSVIAIASGPVYAGQLIGYVGSTGASNYNHLHFEVRINGVAVTNPEDYIR